MSIHQVQHIDAAKYNKIAALMAGLQEVAYTGSYFSVVLVNYN